MNSLKTWQLGFQKINYGYKKERQTTINGLAFSTISTPISIPQSFEFSKGRFRFFNDPRSFLYIFLRNKLKFELPSRHDKIVKIE